MRSEQLQVYEPITLHNTFKHGVADRSSYKSHHLCPLGFTGLHQSEQTQPTRRKNTQHKSRPSTLLKMVSIKIAIITFLVAAVSADQFAPAGGCANVRQHIWKQEDLLALCRTPLHIPQNSCLTLFSLVSKWQPLLPSPGTMETILRAPRRNRLVSRLWEGIASLFVWMVKDLSTLKEATEAEPFFKIVHDMLYAKRRELGYSFI